jgi:hypothetical protein
MKRIRPAPMGRAYRYQRRLTHIVLSVAEREGSEKSLVTKVEEPAAAVETAKTGKDEGSQGQRPRQRKAKKAYPQVSEGRGSRIQGNQTCGRSPTAANQEEGRQVGQEGF